MPKVIRDTPLEPLGKCTVRRAIISNLKNHENQIERLFACNAFGIDADIIEVTLKALLNLLDLEDSPA